MYSSMVGVVIFIWQINVIFVLTESGNALERTTVSRITNLKQLDPIVKDKLNQINGSINEGLYDSNHKIPNSFTRDDHPRVCHLFDVVDVTEFAEELKNVVNNDDEKN
jgi:hypothetical protein